eukprot:gnl/TRDRNA2_/TRDRNA2_126326_c0_seq2.p1 gnl/TRDRNA2_/TRDRNA2_126326_c0~~gnl/TRDRNA2_/TRDRNA2_126326_c0_seq2.p1  ORF type:complete len:268 (+),score=45.99 gnl/TRDRNA2_/TRDRNA2_126326_c0_seq2:63-866(+)
MVALTSIVPGSKSPVENDGSGSDTDIGSPVCPFGMQVMDLEREMKVMEVSKTSDDKSLPTVCSSDEHPIECFSSSSRDSTPSNKGQRSAQSLTFGQTLSINSKDSIRSVESKLSALSEAIVRTTGKARTFAKELMRRSQTLEEQLHDEDKASPFRCLPDITGGIVPKFAKKSPYKKSPPLAQSALLERRNKPALTVKLPKNPPRKVVLTKLGPTKAMPATRGGLNEDSPLKKEACRRGQTDEASTCDSSGSTRTPPSNRGECFVVSL